MVFESNVSSRPHAAGSEVRIFSACESLAASRNLASNNQKWHGSTFKCSGATLKVILSAIFESLSAFRPSKSVSVGLFKSLKALVFSN